MNADKEKREERDAETYAVIGAKYKADFVCFGSIILELKALSALCSNHEAQVVNYLKATGFERGLLINFGASKLQYKRLILSK